MNLPSPAGRKLLPIPISVLLTLLWVGLVRLFFMFIMAKAQGQLDGDLWLARVFAQRVLGRGSLPTLMVGISFLLLIYLWVDYRSHPVRGWRSLSYLVAAALLAYLGWAVWFFWWGRIDVLTEPVDMLMTGWRLTAGPAVG